MRSLGLAALGVIQQLTAAAQQVRQAALMGGGGELPIRRPPIAFQYPRIPLAEHHRGILEATADAPPPASRSRRGRRPGWPGCRPPAPDRSVRPVGPPDAAPAPPHLG